MIEGVLKLPRGRLTVLNRYISYEYLYALGTFSLLGFDTGYINFVAVVMHGVAIEKIAVDIANSRVEIAWPLIFLVGAKRNWRRTKKQSEIE
jgi:hypothetical protein